MVAIHLTFQCRADTGDYGGKIGPTVLQTITVYLMACTKPRTNPVVPSVLDNTNKKNLEKKNAKLNDSKGNVCVIFALSTPNLYMCKCSAPRKRLTYFCRSQMQKKKKIEP